MSQFIPADRVGRINESPSSAAAARVRTLKSTGIPIIDLTVGEPDFDTPQHIKDAAIAAIMAGETKYTPVNGTPALRDAIVRRLERTTGIRYEHANITVGGGGKQVIFVAFMATLNAGDEVIIPAPHWVSYPDMVRANDGNAVIVNTRDEDSFKLTPADLENAITSRTKWLVLNTPSNPTGATYSGEELRGLADVLSKHPHVSVLLDEIYDEISYTGERALSLLAVAPELRDQGLLVNGVSKAYSMTGWRLGYAAGSAALVGAINKLQSQISSCPSSISQAAAVAALDGPQDFIAETVAVYQQRRDRALEALGAIDGLNPIVPDGAFYLFVNCDGVIGKVTPSGMTIETDQDFTLYLLDHVQVAVIQGSAYGLKPFFRISFATDIDTITAGAAAIARAVGDLT